MKAVVIAAELVFFALYIIIDIGDIQQRLCCQLAKAFGIAGGEQRGTDLEMYTLWMNWPFIREKNEWRG